MSIANIISKIKGFEENKKERLFVVFMIFLVGTASFGLGRLSVVSENKTPIRIEEAFEDSNIISGKAKGPNISITDQEKGIVASKSGTSYYFPTCSGVSRVNPENRIYFNSAKEAEKFGYHLASGCEK